MREHAELLLAVAAKFLHLLVLAVQLLQVHHRFAIGHSHLVGVVTCTVLYTLIRVTDISLYNWQHSDETVRPSSYIYDLTARKKHLLGQIL